MTHLPQKHITNKEIKVGTDMPFHRIGLFWRSNSDQLDIQSQVWPDEYFGYQIIDRYRSDSVPTFVNHRSVLIERESKTDQLGSDLCDWVDVGIQFTCNEILMFVCVMEYWGWHVVGYQFLHVTRYQLHFGYKYTSPLHRRLEWIKPKTRKIKPQKWP